MTTEARTPVIVGVGQVTQKLDDVDQAVEPALLMEVAVRRAIMDTGNSGLAGELDLVAVVGGVWSYPDPGRLVADRLGADDAATLLTYFGGNSPQELLTAISARIQRGDLDLAVITGGEAMYSRRKLRQLGRELVKREWPEVPPAERFGADLPMSTDFAEKRGFTRPPEVYPLFEAALRAHKGETIEANRRRISRLWEGFNRVARANPYAWVQMPMTAEEIATPTADNRMVGFPYTKAMNANMFVDQASSVVVCSAEKARELGIPTWRWVFPVAATRAHDTLDFAARDNFHSSPGIRIAGSRALELSGFAIDELTHLDLYSCFPSVVQIAIDELRIAQGAIHTVTGGLSFFGGPMNNYVGHAIVSMVEAVRESGGRGLVHANGGYVTKHAFCTYDVEPRSAGFVHEDVQSTVDQFPVRHVSEDHVGEFRIETYTVLHDHAGPIKVLVTGLLPDGRRVLGSSSDLRLLSAMVTSDGIGEHAHLDAEGIVRLS